MDTFREFKKPFIERFAEYINTTYPQTFTEDEEKTILKNASIIPDKISNQFSFGFILSKFTKNKNIQMIKSKDKLAALELRWLDFQNTITGNNNICHIIE
jgi:hypothetical protein